MLTILACLAIFVASSAAAAVPAAEALPSSSVMPLVISVTAASDISRPLIAAALKESDAVWRASGFRFVWQLEGRAISGLHVNIGGGQSTTTSAMTPLGWINVDGSGLPEPNIYLSYANAMRFLVASRLTVGQVDRMPMLQRDTYLARALGRALAHEVGHYLMGSTQHAARGLMMAVHSSTEFFAPDRRTFSIDADERQRMAARFTSIYMASRG